MKSEWWGARFLRELWMLSSAVTNWEWEVGGMPWGRFLTCFGSCFGTWWKNSRKKCVQTPQYTLCGEGSMNPEAHSDSFRIHTLQVRDLWTEFWLYANFPSGVWCVSENSVQEGFSVFPRTKQWQKQLISDKCTFLCKASSLPISPLLPTSNAQPVNF